MKQQELKETLIAYSKDIHVDAIGFCSAKPFLQLEDRLIDRERKGYMCSLESRAYKEKADPTLNMPDAKSFVVILESYDRPVEAPTETLSGHISMAAVARDYHKIVMEKLQQLADFMERQVTCKTIAYVDRSPFSDRTVATRAGLGFIGKNSMLINHQYGSKVYIGYLLTDYDFHADDRVIQTECGTCTRCMKTCPTEAIIGDSNVDCTRCLSYMTQHKGAIASEFKKKMGRQIYGCDICQLVCPYNQVLNVNHEPIIASYPSYKELLDITNRGFKETYGQTASGWRGKKLLQRNAIIGLGNSNSIEALEVLENYIHDSRDDIRLEIIDAIRRLGYVEGMSILCRMLEDEKDEDIRHKIHEVIREIEER